MAIVIVGMLDEREEALKIIRAQIRKRGHKTILIDVSIGTGGIIPSLKADVTPEEIAHLGGGTIKQIKEMLVTERGKATSIVAEGLAKKITELYRAKKLEGMIAIAGTTGTFISLAVMRALPFGVPKLLISSVTVASVYTNMLTDYLGARDITVMHSVVDTVGLNSLVRTLAVNGANAICGMVEGWSPFEKEKKPSIALTEFGFCDKGAHYVRNLLKKDYDFISFHATGLGDRAAMDLVNQGFFEAFIDLVPASFSEYLLGGNRASGPNRLDIALHASIPYILTPCGFDMISCGPINRKDKGDPLWTSRKLAERKFLIQDAVRVQVRTNVEEMESIAKAVAEKLNQYPNKNLVKFVIPQKGFSSLSVERGVLYDPIADKAFVETLRKDLDPGIKMIEVNTDINNPQFAQAIVKALKESLKSRRS
jgi:uncharacterized protein (UPF0261 family)